MNLVKKITKEFRKLRAKSYSYLIDDGSEDKKANGIKNCVIKKNLILKIIKTDQRHNLLTEKINKIAVNLRMIKECNQLT